ncbi:hypothetical protein CXG81DRAFT_29759 [Caulochytrium protostelioides]|uniref:CP-type G domain-containing protein n=1 Tax=Caulochytrium protostelioides TaxID=1555241 RepID=A0A4P9X8I8_9FUNG|nr:hypothetical protein CXG81DRAFT_29759 [Caulochytrium protostelioides]|eukprot:RKP01380.1 hypothetical protein CXG81DRAFT_29759 [Caulochytrium protostelioides]
MSKLKSGRTTTRQRAKITKRVNEHHRKQRKLARKNPQTKRLKKDPGIPKLIPFRDEVVKQVQEAKAALEALIAKANERASLFEAAAVEQQNMADQAVADAALGKRDDSRSAYFREFRKVVDQADVILQVLDARDPMGCRTREIERMILNAGVNKRIILILNKVDLVPKEVTEQWLKYLRNEFPTLAFKASTQMQRNNLGQSKTDIGQMSGRSLAGSSECVGADALIQLLKNYCRNANIKTAINVGVVGFPNVGKSSLINSLKRSRVCSAGSTPGVTKGLQFVQLDKNIKLIDSPGIVFSKQRGNEDLAATLLRNCVKVQHIDDPIQPVQLIIERCTPEALMVLYKIPAFETIGRKRGYMKRGGAINIPLAARTVIIDWNNGRIPYHTLPPATDAAGNAVAGADGAVTDDRGAPANPHVSSAVVSQWCEEFSLPEVIAVEGRDLTTATINGVEGSFAVASMGEAHALDHASDAEEASDEAMESDEEMDSDEDIMSDDE